MQFTPAGASAAHQKLGAGPPGRPIEAASAGGAPERVHVAKFPITRSSGRASRVCITWIRGRRSLAVILAGSAAGQPIR